MKQYVATAVLLIIVPAIAWAADITTTGELIVDPPTLMAIGIAWPIEGDDNRNARVSISYRKKGEVEWSQGLDPLRLQNEQTYTRGSLDYTAPNMFAGSLFDLEEDTEYEVRLQLQDPDGVQGGSGKTVAIRTRAEPQPASNGRIFHVYPPGYAGNRQEPAFSGLLEAYYMASLGGDWSRASPPRVRPGDIIKVHAGVYLSKHDHYSHELNSRFTTCCGTPWDATYYLTQDGTAERPIAIVAAGDGEVIFDGDGNAVLFNLMGAQYHYFEGISFRNTGTAIEAGMKDIAGAQGITVKHSRFENIGTAVHSDWSGSSGFYIADNDMLGREDLNYVYTWYAIKPWSDRPDFAERAKLKSFYAISIYGQGHVIAYNRVRGFHDGIDHATYGMPDNYPDTPQERLPVAIDIYNNDVSVVHDNCFEADGSVRNVRVMRNRCFNAPLGAMSPQPVLGGPVYFIRNIVYNAWWGPVKIHGEPSGVYYLNNTYIGEFKQLTPMSNVHLRNNLLLGQGTAPRLLSLDTFTNYSSSDYNGFRPNPESQEAFAWNSPPFEEVRNFYPAHRDPLQNTPIALTQRAFPTLQAYSRETGQDRHSRLVDYDIFVHAPMPDFSDPTRVVAVDSVDLRLREGATAIDAGIALPNVTDGFKGSAPDLGAYEFGEPLPRYGPRPRPD
ncbi:MAG: hypothetical protein A3I78_10625 [Gammaproteobacteria bacterium RIFCSPLOWO2_02_FULL_56_15]|nr:MAG: hypothetical protein A3I78_10625 [Gammaproteobacteria bacterium RIFCSPLOWO2_02_FULL_56_15]